MASTGVYDERSWHLSFNSHPRSSPLSNCKGADMFVCCPTTVALLHSSSNQHCHALADSPDLQMTIMEAMRPWLCLQTMTQTRLISNQPTTTQTLARTSGRDRPLSSTCLLLADGSRQQQPHAAASGRADGRHCNSCSYSGCLSDTEQYRSRPEDKRAVLHVVIS
jgi:hypothetical protein